MVYKWSYNVAGLDANVAGSIFEGIEKRDGKLTKEAVVNEARPESSPLHGHFEWDDSIAGEKYRQEQARLMIGNLTVVYDRPEKEPVVTRAYVSTNSSRSGRAVYARISDALNDTVSRGVLIENAKEELRAFQRKYSNLVELSKVLLAIDDWLEGNNDDITGNKAI